MRGVIWRGAKLLHFHVNVEEKMSEHQLTITVYPL